MAKLLKQSTAYTFRLGPFVDSTDGNTQENALTIAATDVLISKAGGAYAAKNDSTALTGTGANAHYTCILNTTDTNTLGALEAFCHVSGALYAKDNFEVVPAMIYDSLVAGTDRFDVNITHVGDTAQTANDNGADINAILTDTNELQTDWTNAGRLDAILDIIAADTTTDIPALIATAQADLDIITGATGVNLLAATQASIDAIEVDTSTTLETHLTDIKGTGFGKDTHSLPQCLTATGFSTHDAAAVKTAIEADGGDLSSLMEALVNQQKVRHTAGGAGQDVGDVDIYNDSDVSQGEVDQAYSEDAAWKIRKRLFK